MVPNMTSFTKLTIPARLAVSGEPSLLALGQDTIHNIVHLIDRVQVGNIATGQEVIKVHQETLVGDLAVREEEQDTLVLETSTRVHHLQIVLQI